MLVAEDLAPADTAGLDPALVLALVTERGGPTSHTAIIARQLGHPLRGRHRRRDDDRRRHPAAGRRHRRHRRGRAGRRAEAEARVAADRELRAPRCATWSGPGATADGRPVKILANVADGESARSAAQAPVEGVGLFRTELCFLNRKDEPSVEEQADIYGERARAVRRLPGDRTGTSWSARSTPARTSRWRSRPTRARRTPPSASAGCGSPSATRPCSTASSTRSPAPPSATGTEAWVMAPMVATVAEAEDFAGKVHARGLKAGVMVEVPSAALLAHRMLEVVDFLSIGTNDLTQYTMAADRMATDLAHLTDPWQPAVLQLIAITAEAGRRDGKPVGVCGEAAADPLLACALVGMGITSLSMAAAAVRTGRRPARDGEPPGRARTPPRPRSPRPTRRRPGPPCWRCSAG